MEYIDLGLSVKWAKYNLGATGGSDISSWLGDYYAWGETEIKSDYKWSTYTWANDNGTTITKYNSTDGKATLESADDIITFTYGGNWRMPTPTELNALITLPNTWVTNYNGITGLNGRTFTGNDNTLFIPAAGYFTGLKLYNANSYRHLWSSFIYSDYTNRACDLCFDSNYIGVYYSSRYFGFSVRGVCS